MIAIFDALGHVAIVIALIIIGLLSRRLGQATRARPFYIGHFAAAGLIGISASAHIVGAVNGMPGDAQSAGIEWVLLVNGLPALAFTLALYVTWRYWSWLLAERD